MSYLVCDIESVPTERAMAEPYPELTRPHPKTHTKPESIAAWRERDRLDWEVDRIKTYSLNPRQGRICCIGWDDGVAGDAKTWLIENEADEKAILSMFWDLIGPNTQLVTFNGRTFDLPFIVIRSLIHGITAPQRCGVASWYRRYTTDTHFDCRAVLSGWDDRAPGTLHDWALAFGIPIAGPLISGGEVYAAAQAGRWDDISAHCLDDVRVTRELYLRLSTVF